VRLELTADGLEGWSTTATSPSTCGSGCNRSSWSCARCCRRRQFASRLASRRHRVACGFGLCARRRCRGSG